MTGGGDAGMQLIYMEVEGIKLAYQISKDAVKILWQLGKFLFCALKDAPYKKTHGKTNLKNLLARAGGRPLMAVTVDQETYKALTKDLDKHGVLYQAFHPLRSGKRGAVEILFTEKDMAMVQELLSRYKEKRVKEDVKNGMSKEQAEQNFTENNREESMEEFADHVGATAPEEEFEAGMKERFGEDYEDNIIHFEQAKEKTAPKSKTAGREEEKVDHLADVIHFRERAEKLKKDAPVEIQFIYDEKKGKSQIVAETETHVKIASKGLAGEEGAWKYFWVPKENIIPPLDQEPGDGGMRTVKLEENADVLVEDAAGKKEPEKVKAEELNYQSVRNENIYAAEESSYQWQAPEKEVDITIGKTYPNVQSDNKMAPAMIWEENSRALKTRIPGTYGEKMRFLWLPKERMMDTFDGKSILTSLEKDKDYKIYDADNHVTRTMKGEELYRAHYDRAGSMARKKAGIPEMAGRGRKL